MKEFFKILAIACLVAALPAAAAAQDEEAASAAKAAADEFLATLKGFDESLAGVYWFGLYLNRMQNIGSARLEVARAPAESGGVYSLRLEMKLQMGPKAFHQDQEAILDEKFGLVSMKSEEDMPQGKKRFTVVKDQGTWKYEVAWSKAGNEEQTKTMTLPVSGLNHKERSSGLLALRKLDLSSERDLLFKGVAWPDVEDGEEGEPREIDLWLKVQAPSQQKHRGAEVKASLVRVVDSSDDEVTIVMVGEGGGILGFWPEEAPIAIIAGTEEESRKSLPSEKPAKTYKTASTPAEAVVTYLMVLAKEYDVDALDAVMDWKAIRDEGGKSDEGVAAMTPETVAGILKARFEKVPKTITLDMIKTIEPLLTTVENGDEATVQIPGTEKTFTVTKVGDSWRFQSIPK